MMSRVILGYRYILRMYGIYIGKYETWADIGMYAEILRMYRGY